MITIRIKIIFNFSYFRETIKKSALKVKNSTELYKNSNKTFDDVWSFTASATDSNEEPVVCTSINLFNLKLEEYQTFSFIINDTLPKPTGFLIYASSPFQFNPNKDNNNNFDMIPSGDQRMMKIKMKNNERKSTRKYECDVSNQAKYTQCIESFMVRELHCRPSWFQIVDNKIHLCNGSEKYLKYLALIQDLSKSNCMVPNCKKNEWETQEIWTTKSPLPNTTLIQYWLHTKTVKVSEEVFTYGVFDIFNDFAGVLSLCLGVSIISFYDYIVDTSKKIYFTLTTLKK